MTVTEEALRQAIEGAPPHPLFDDIPASLKPWLLPVRWDRDRLWGIRHDPIQLPIDELRWLYDLPLWRGRGGRWFEVTPRAFMACPRSYPEHAKRVAGAQLSYPIHVIRRRQRFFVLDGVHRIVRADLEGRDAIAAIVLSAADVEWVVTPPAQSS